MRKKLVALLAHASVLLLPASGAVAADEKTVEGIVTFVEETTAKVKSWKAAWLCDASAMQITILQCQMFTGDLKSAAEGATLSMKAPFATLQSSLAILRKELPESHGVRCRAEWIDLISCHAQLRFGAVVLRGRLRALEPR